MCYTISSSNLSCLWGPIFRNMLTSLTSPTNLISKKSHPFVELFLWISKLITSVRFCCSAAMYFIRCCRIKQANFCKTIFAKHRSDAGASSRDSRSRESASQMLRSQTLTHRLAQAKGNTVDCTSKRSWLWYPGLCLLRVWNWSTHTSAQQLVCNDILYSQCSVWWVWNLTPVRAQDSVTSK